MKFWQTLDPKIFKQLEVLAAKRGIEVQAYIRAIVIPEHLQSLPKPIIEKKYSKRAKKAWATRRLNKYNKEFKKDDTVPIAPEMPKQ